ncbi:trypsin-like peptidase domain-containing protein [Bradyrhizobium liaoningense]
MSVEQRSTERLEDKVPKLSGEDITKLSKSLADTLNFDDLKDFVHASTGDRLYVEYVGEGRPLRQTIVDLLNVLEQRGTSPLFLHYVYAWRPGRPDIRKLIADLCPVAVDAVPDQTIALSLQKAGRVQADAPTNAFAPGLQRNVRPYLAKPDVLVWITRLSEICHRVCRIERAGTGLGTGFLVGPDTVLTNWHVIKDVNAEGKLAEVGCRFDYVRLASGAMNPGQLVALRPDGCLSFSPYSMAETTATPEVPAPTIDELDFALLQLETTAAQQRIDGAKRGWIALPREVVPLPRDTPLLIVQHPQGEPMKVAMDTQAVIGPNSNGTRIKYSANTDPGSSGSPCFTMEWEIVALHHYGDPNYWTPKFNQGVPINLIRQRIEAQGLGNALGQ